MNPTTDDRLSKRYWIVKNFDWLMDEVIFHKENHEYYKNRKIHFWDLGAEKGQADLDEITRRSD